MDAEKIAQWVIDNRYPKSELDKISDFELYHGLVDKIKELVGERSKEEVIKQSLGKKYPNAKITFK